MISIAEFVKISVHCGRIVVSSTFHYSSVCYYFIWDISVRQNFKNQKEAFQILIILLIFLFVKTDASSLIQV